MDRRSTLEAEFAESRHELNGEYIEFLERIETHRAAVNDAMGDLSSDSEFVGTVREIASDADERNTQTNENP